MSSIDGDGNIQVLHPSGAYIRIGETPDKVDPAGKNADASLKADRNTGRKVNVRIGLAGNAVVVTLTPDGNITMKLDKDFTVEAGGKATFKAPGGMTFDTPDAHFTGNVVVDGMLTYKGGMSGSGGSANLQGDLNVEGNQSITGNVAAGGSITDGDGDGGA